MTSLDAGAPFGEVNAAMLRHRRRSGATRLVVAVALWLVSGTPAASWILGAQTVSVFDTWVSLAGSPATLAANPDAYAGGATQSGAVSLATTVRATQKALGLPLTVSNGVSFYWADASVDLSVTAADQVVSGGALAPGEPLVIFHGSHATAALTTASEPLFARAATISQGVLDGVILKAPGPVGVEVAWDLELLGLTAIPTAALAYVSDRVELFHVTATGTERIGEAGFRVWLEDGEATLQVMDGAGSFSLTAPLGEQLELPTGGLMTVSLPLPAGVESLALRVVNTHAEVSVAAAPRATVPVLTGAGYLSQSVSAPDREAPLMYWDPEMGSLGFDPIPILWSEGVLTPGADDPLFSGQIEITGLHWVGSTDGRFYFAGGTLTLRDRFGTPLLSVSLPSLVFEDSLFAFQGLNGFAPILQMLEVQTHSSDWLNGFIDLMGLTAPYLPEIFLGFDHLALGDDLWTHPFDVPVYGLLSFVGAAPPLDLDGASQAVPLPGTVSLLAVGLALMMIRCRTGWAGAADPRLRFAHIQDEHNGSAAVGRRTHLKVQTKTWRGNSLRTAANNQSKKAR